MVKERKLRSSGLATTTLQGSVKKGEQIFRRRGRQIILKSGQEYKASSTAAAENMTRWKGVFAGSSVVPQ